MVEQDKLVMTQRIEPKEGAFTFLLPKDWLVEGGIYYVNPMAVGGMAQSLAPKCDLVLKSDQAGTVLLHWLPEITYQDPRYLANSMLGWMSATLPNNGLQSQVCVPPVQFLTEVLFPAVHPQATDVQVISGQAEEELARRQAAQAPMPLAFDAASVIVTYTENSVRYKERLQVCIENMGQMGMGIWYNKAATLFRAPEEAYDRWLPVFETIINSVWINPTWALYTQQGIQYRSAVMLDTQRYEQAVMAQMAADRQAMNWGYTHRNAYYSFTPRMSYLNPYTNYVEYAPAYWPYRWMSPAYNMVYSHDPNYDPNHDVMLGETGYRRCEPHEG